VSGEIIFAVKDQPAEVHGGDVEEFGPFFAIFEVEYCLSLVAGTDPDIEPGAGGAGFEHGIQSVGFGGADLARFFPDAEVPGIVEPSSLSGEEPGAFRKFNFGAGRLG
jgi:hypothetical protein